ncbi:MAG: DNA repair protein RecN [Planctomycetota bacterium]
MLQELYITNFVLMDKVTINLCERLNIFSGATGVGKSLILGAINFILGGRATADVVQTGKDEATVIGKFYVNNKRLLKVIKSVSNNPDIEEDILVQRSIDKNGRSRCRLNDVPITVSLLKDIGDLLANIHGQHEHEALLQGINQLYILDSFGGTTSLREEFTRLFQQTTEKIRLRDTLKNSLQERSQKIDLYAFQIDEIDKAQLKPGEAEELERERGRLSNAEKIHSNVASSYAQLYESSDAVVERLKSILRELQFVSKFDDTINKISDACAQSLFQLEDAAFSLGKYKEGFNYDPQRLEYIEERLSAIRKLKSKYGDTIEEILSYRNEVAEKLKQLSEEGTTADQIEKELGELSKSLKSKGNELTQRRLTAAGKLAPLINDELHDLGMPHGRFSVQIASLSLNQDGDFDVLSTNSHGFDQVDFLISPNPGEDLKPLRKIASGGEISRVMLALKHQLAKVDSTPVLVFDEIDANIGGRMGEIIGEKLSSIASSRQVICITHLPQIASYADEHWKVSKVVKNGKTYSNVEHLSDEARLEEIADMIRGSEKTDITRKQAQEMLRDAKRKVKNRS